MIQVTAYEPFAAAQSNQSFRRETVAPEQKRGDMGKSPRVMMALVRFSNLLAPVLADGADAATVALLANTILETRRIHDVDVIPLTTEPELTDTTLFALRSGFAVWYAVRLLIDQGKLSPDPRVPVRVHLSETQWDKAGEIAHEAADAHRTLRDRQARRRARGTRTPRGRLVPA